MSDHDEHPTNDTEVHAPLPVPGMPGPEVPRGPEVPGGLFGAPEVAVPAAHYHTSSR